ncbi:MAG: class I SAM-dependent methyltransferase [Azospirillaceae bacterium]
MRPTERIAYRVSQGARAAWYLGHYVTSQRLSRGSFPRMKASGKGPGWGPLLADMRQLFDRDLANIVAGYYRMPHDLLERPDRLWRNSAAFFRDLPEVNRRRRGKQFQDVPDASDDLPKYYRRAFHWQSDGYLSDRSASLYDTQVEILFGGTADAMRRQIIPPIVDWMRDRQVSHPRLLDVATGTGRFLSFLLQSHPSVEATALDLSAPYLAHARRNTRRFAPIDTVEGKAEALPYPDSAFDIVTSIFLFHEIPPAVRRRAFAEMARVARPGGLVVVMDSLQFGDHAPYDPLLEIFPQMFHEPYYRGYARERLGDCLTAAGLLPIDEDRSYLAKWVAAVKPGN